MPLVFVHNRFPMLEKMPPARAIAQSHSVLAVTSNSR